MAAAAAHAALRSSARPRRPRPSCATSRSSPLPRPLALAGGAAPPDPARWTRHDLRGAPRRAGNPRLAAARAAAARETALLSVAAARPDPRPRRHLVPQQGAGQECERLLLRRARPALEREPRRDRPRATAASAMASARRSATLLELTAALERARQDLEVASDQAEILDRDRSCPPPPAASSWRGSATRRARRRSSTFSTPSAPFRETQREAAASRLALALALGRGPARWSAPTSTPGDAHETDTHAAWLALLRRRWRSSPRSRRPCRQGRRSPAAEATEAPSTKPRERTGGDARPGHLTAAAIAEAGITTWTGQARRPRAPPGARTAASATTRTACCQVAANVRGRVVAIPVDLGARVRKGDPLLRSRASSSAARARSSCARLLGAPRRRTRLRAREERSSRPRRSAPASSRSREGDYLSKRAAVEAAERTLHLYGDSEEQVARLRARVESDSQSAADRDAATLTLRAPFAGRVIDRKVTPGRSSRRSSRS